MMSWYRLFLALTIVFSRLGPCGGFTISQSSRLFRASSIHGVRYERATSLAELVDDKDHPFVTDIGSIPYHRMHLLSARELYPKSSLEILTKWVHSNSIKDLLVVSHGWNTPPKAAWENYNDLFNEADTLWKQIGETTSNLGILGITWDSKTADDPIQQLDKLIEEFPKDAEELEKIKEAAQKLIDEGVNPDDVFDMDLPLFARMASYRMTLPEERDETEIAAFAERYREQVVDFIRKDGAIEKNYGFDVIESGDVLKVEDAGNVTRGAVDFSEFPSPLNFHLHMKRAARLGRTPVSQTFQAMRRTYPDLRIHLIGHSFGALLVTSAVNSDSENLEVSPYASMILVQGAFSQHAFTPKSSAWSWNPTKWPRNPLKWSFNVFKFRDKGMFRGILDHDLVAGPIAVTHTRNDRALAVAYPSAVPWILVDGSRIPGTRAITDDLTRIFDATGCFVKEVAGELTVIFDMTGRFGAIGCNGARGLVPEEVNNINIESYELKNKGINNIKADKEFQGHNDVWKESLARLILQAVRQSRSA